MEQIILFMSKNVPEIMTSSVSVLCYILFFIIKIKVNKSGKSLHALVKDKIRYIDKENTDIKSQTRDKTIKIDERIIVLEQRLNTLEQYQKKSENVLKSMIEEDTQ